MPLLKVKDVALRLNLSAAKVYELVEQGKLPHFRLEGSIRISDGHLAEYLESCEHGRSEKATGWSRKTSPAAGSAFKHLDGDRLQQAWQQRDGRSFPKREDTAQ